MIADILTGGDDYELAFTVPARHTAGIANLAARGGVPLTAIGRIVAGDGVKVLDAEGRAMALPAAGYRHR